MHTSLIDYIRDRERRNQLIDALGTSYDYLWQIATGWRGRRASPDMAIRINRHTGGIVTKESLRPDIWPPASKSEAA